MKTATVTFACVTFAIILVLQAEAKGGRGRSGGRSSGRSGGRGGGGFFSFFGGGSKSSSSGGSKSTGSKDSGSSSHYSNSLPKNGGFFHGFVHSTPYHYRPMGHSYIGGGHASQYSESSRDNSYKEDDKQQDMEKDEAKYAAGYAVSKALSNDFISVFKMVHEISEDSKHLKNKNFKSDISTTLSPSMEITPTTTESSNKYFTDDYSTSFDFQTTTPTPISEAADEATELPLNFMNFLSNEKSRTDFSNQISSINEMVNFLKPSSEQNTKGDHLGFEEILHDLSLI